jgi:hypothetical protein
MELIGCAFPGTTDCVRQAAAEIGSLQYDDIARGQWCEGIGPSVEIGEFDFEYTFTQVFNRRSHLPVHQALDGHVVHQRHYVHQLHCRSPKPRNR